MILGINFDLLKNAVDESATGMIIFTADKNDEGEISDFLLTYMDKEALKTINAPNDDTYINKRFVESTQTSKKSAFFKLLSEIVKTGKAVNTRTRFNTIGKGVTELYYDVHCVKYDEAVNKLDEQQRVNCPQHEDSVVVTLRVYEGIMGVPDVNTYFANNSSDIFALFEYEIYNGKEDLKIIAANQTFSSMVGFGDVKNFIGKHYSDIYQGAEWMPFYVDVAKTGDYVLNEAFNHHVNAYLSCVVYSPEVGQCTMIGVDRTHLWKSEQGMLSKSEDLSAVFHSMTSGICIGKILRDEQGKATDMRFDLVNPYYEIFEGHPTGTLQGKNLFDVTEKDAYFEKYVEIADKKSKETFNKYISLSDATLEINCFSTGDDIVIFVEYDITARVKAEQALAKSEAALAEKLNNINESIRYASKIQRNLLPGADKFEKAFSDYSIRWEPRDIVGGDILWIKNFEAGTVLCVADCTGHGTPGALLTMLVSSAFEDMVNENNCRDTAQVIWELERRLINIFGRTAEDTGPKDGCDLAVMFIAKDGSLAVSSAHTHIFICDGKEVTQLKGQGIFVGEGKLKSKDEIDIIQIPANPDNKFYIASDGLYDQPGGKKDRPYGYKKFKEIILENHNESQSTISDLIWAAYEEYRGESLRVDDFELITFKP